ncbi:MAG: helix-turn-helix transcriptional regulator [Clostridia bacterium]|nr:helix-turn-helix transcriptional regulator [Clostridia bacterium]
MKLNNNIRRLRFERNEMSQQELADLIGVSRMTIYSMEKGKYVPSTVLALRISKVFGKPVEEIFELVDEKEVGKHEK